MSKSRYRNLRIPWLVALTPTLVPAMAIALSSELSRPEVWSRWCHSELVNVTYVVSHHNLLTNMLE